METFWDSNVWGGLSVVMVLLASLLVANMLKRSFAWLQASLIPTSVLAGGILITVAGIYKAFTGQIMFDTPFFGGNGTDYEKLSGWQRQFAVHALLQAAACCSGNGYLG